MSGWGEGLSKTRLMSEIALFCLLFSKKEVGQFFG
jgi:hypothetical protein